jgi:eukaryotic-like serine/threonine-protein kinase
LLAVPRGESSISSMIGDLIDHYRVLELVGRGAMGVVYKALDVNLDRLVAIKVMSAEARGDPDFVERFRQEARLQGALNHSNVALLFDYFVHDGAPVAVLEFIDGESLAQSIRRRGPIPAEESIPIFKQALRGVAAAHRAGIIHRDLKPANLMLTKDGIVKVMDFGIAKRQGATGATQVSTSVGSPLYMAPEQILGRAVDCRTDVYALGITLYELLTGQRPFNPRGKPEYLVLNAHVNDLPEPPTVHCGDIPQPIVDAVMRSLAKEPDARFQSADEFMRALPDVGAPDAAPPRVDPADTMAFDYSAGTLLKDFYPRGVAAQPAATASPAVVANVTHAGTPVARKLSDDSRRSSPAPSPAAQGLRGTQRGLTQLLRAGRLGIVAVIVTMLVLGTRVHHSKRLQAMRQDASVASSGPSVTPARAQASTATQTSASTKPSTMPPARQDLSGTWRGEYIDASGKQLLRVVNLRISRVHDDGGIEGTLRYEAASGDGECKLHPRGSSYSAGEQRLQLSPESCSPHYPKELGVPLDFEGVSPQANALKDGRIEAPTGEVIRVKLTRASGI